MLAIERLLSTSDILRRENKASNYRTLARFTNDGSRLLALSDSALRVQVTRRRP